MLEVRELLGVVHLAGVEEVAIMLRALADLLDIGISARLIALEVIGDDLGSNALVACPGKAGIELRKLDGLRKGLHPVCDLGEAGVLLLEFEESLLVGGVGVQLVLPRWAVHGSVGCVDTWVTTVPPRTAAAARTTAAACSSHGHSLAQWAMSMRAQASPAR